jgi:glycerol-3-phosphate acyltransferase PlsY
MELLEVLLLIPLFYVYGSIPFTVIITYIAKRDVIYERGSKDISVTKVFAVAGLLPGLLSILGEITKVAFPLIICRYFFNGNVNVALVFIAATLVGCTFSIFLRGTRGYGFTVLLWSLIFLSPITLVLFFLILFIIYIISKRRLLPTRIMFILPVLLLITEKSIPFLLFGLLYTALLYMKNPLMKQFGGSLVKYYKSHKE